VSDDTDLVMEVAADGGLKAGARLIVNTLPVADSEDSLNNHDRDMEELTGKMYVLSVSVSVS